MRTLRLMKGNKYSVAEIQALEYAFWWESATLHSECHLHPHLSLVITYIWTLRYLLRKKVGEFSSIVFAGSTLLCDNVLTELQPRLCACTCKWVVFVSRAVHRCRHVAEWCSGVIFRHIIHSPCTGKKYLIFACLLCDIDSWYTALETEETLMPGCCCFSLVLTGANWNGIGRREGETKIPKSFFCLGFGLFCLWAPLSQPVR